MKLSIETLQNQTWWKENNYILPQFDVKQVAKQTKENPVWLHFGAGNIFRIFPALVQQKLLNQGLTNSGIIVCETFDEEIITKAFRPFDNLGIGITLESRGNIQKEIIASITETLTKNDRERLQEIFCSSSLQMISFTITEKGYSLKNMKGEYFPNVKNDLENFSDSMNSLIGIVAYLCYCRFQAGQTPITLVSMDNCSHNGTILKNAVMEFVHAWCDSGFVPAEFKEYMMNEEKVSFPWSMIDKITPRPNEFVSDILQKDGLKDTEITITNKNSYVSVFVNAEEVEYLVIEDRFPNGRPPLEKAGVLFGTRDTVDQIEKMKVCTCLNPLHTALAIYGCLLDFTLISDEVKDPQLYKLITEIGYNEGLPVVVDPKIINPKSFIDTVVNIRFSNPYIPDAPQRIACDTSQKLGIRFGETIKAYLADPKKNVTDLKFIPLVIAGWLRYLLAVNDKGEVIELSPDPLLESVRAHLTGISLGSTDVHQAVQPILSDKSIFGVDLYQAGLATLVETYFLELIKGKGSIRSTLVKYCGDSK